LQLFKTLFLNTDTAGFVSHKGVCVLVHGLFLFRLQFDAVRWGRLIAVAGWREKDGGGGSGPSEAVAEEQRWPLGHSDPRARRQIVAQLAPAQFHQ